MSLARFFYAPRFFGGSIPTQTEPHPEGNNPGLGQNFYQASINHAKRALLKPILPPLILCANRHKIWTYENKHLADAQPVRGMPRHFAVEVLFPA